MSTFADEILNKTLGTRGTETFNRDLVHRIAYTVIHEAAHTLGLLHTGGDSADQLQLSLGDQVRQGMDTRETTNIYTRFALQLDEDPSKTVNNHDSLKNDQDIGLVDANRNAIPDMAYVTGTGAHDRITLTDAGKNATGQRVVRVNVQPFRNPDRTGPIGAALTYDIVIGRDTEGPIRIDGSVGNDFISIAESITSDITVYGGDGNNTIEGGGGSDLIYGEAGNDTISGRGGVDMLLGGRDTDSLDGGAGNDIVTGGSGDDTLLGGNDVDILNGGLGADRLNGGNGPDNINGGPGVDTIVGPAAEDTVVADPTDITANVPLAPSPPKNIAPTQPVAGALTTTQARAIGTALNQVVTLAKSVAGSLSIGTDTVGTILGDMLQRGLVNTVTALLGRGSPTINSVLSVLNNLPTSASKDGLTVNVANISAVGGTAPMFNVTLQVKRESNAVLDNLGDNQAALLKTRASDSAQAKLTSTFQIPLSFGINSTGAFVKVPAAGINLISVVDSSGLVFPASLGLVSAKADDASVELNTATKVVLLGSSDGILSGADLTSTTAATVTQSGSFQLEVPFETQIGVQTHSGVMSIAQTDLSVDATRRVSLTGTDEMKAMASLNGSAILQYLKDLEGVLKNVSSAAELAVSLPFASNLKLNEVADFATALRQQVIGKIIGQAGNPNFQTAQELIDRLSVGAAKDSPPALGLEYDVARKELVFKLNFGQTFSKDATLGIGGNLSRVADVKINNPTVRIQSEVTGGLVFGVKLNVTQSMDSVSERFVLRDASFDAKVTGSISNVGGTARLGIFDLKLVNGGGAINLGVSLQAATNGNLFDLDITPRVTGSAKVSLGTHFDVSGAGVTLPVLPPGTALVIEAPNLAAPSSLSATFTPEADLSGILDSLEAVAMGQIVQGLQRVISFLKDAQSRGVFQQEIPALNRSLADLLNTAEKLEALHRELETNPPTTIGQLMNRINGALDSAAQVRFAGRVFEIDFGYGFTETAKLDLGFDLDDALGAGILEEFIDVNGSAPVERKIEGNAQLGLVIDLNGTTPKFSLKDTSGLSVKTLVNAADIDFAAAIGPLGVFIRDGHVRLGNGTVNQPAVFSVGLAPSSCKTHELSSLNGAAESIVKSTVAGKFDVNLPLHFPTTAEKQGSIHLTVGSLQNIAGTTDLDEAASPDLAAVIGDLDLNALIDLVISGLDRMLREIEKRFDVPDLPLIGDDLSQATTFLRGIRERVVSKLEELSSLSGDVVKEKIVEALGSGPSGLNFLVDRNTDGKIDKNDVTVDFSLAEKRVDVAFRLAGQNVPLNKTINANPGVDGLGLTIKDAALQFKVGFRFDVGFGVSADDGFYMHTGAAGSAPELEINVEAALLNPNAASAAEMAKLTGELGFLEFRITDSFNVVQPDGGHGSFFQGVFALDIVDPGVGTRQDGHLTLAEMRSAEIEDVLKPRLDLDFNLQFHLAADVSDFPAFTADFELVYQFDTGASPAQNGFKKLGFNNVSVNVGEFFTKSIEPVLENVEKVLSPILPVANALTTPLPVISNLAGRPFTLVDLAGQFGKFNVSSLDFVEAVKNVAALRNRINTMLTQLPGQVNGFLPLGNFTLDPKSAMDASKEGKLAPITNASTNENVKDDKGFSIPVLKNPSLFFKLFLGQDIPLVTYDLPRLDFRFDYSQFFPVAGPLGVRLSGNVGAAADMSFGYDTLGLRQFRASGYDDEKLLLNGFYVSDTAKADGSGEDVPEQSFFGGIEAFVSANLGFVEVGGGGGLKAKVNVDMNDPNKDGRMHFQEIVAAFDPDPTDTSGPEFNLSSLKRRMNISGELSGELNVFIKFPLSDPISHPIAKVTLVDFSFTDTPAEPEPVLAEKDAAGVLRINMGPHAGSRLYRGHTVDADERFTIEAPNGDAVKVNFHVIENNVAKTYTQTFAGVTRLEAKGGEGNDTIDISSPIVPVELRGGEGIDTLKGDGNVIVFGGAGNDILSSGNLGATLDGEFGDDEIQGGAGKDIITGGVGNDTLRGGAVNDRIDGGRGNDAIFGEAGVDALFGDEDSDFLFGGLDGDFLNGEKGNDKLFGVLETDSVETTVPSDWQVVDDQLFAREAAIREERKVVDRALAEIVSRIQQLTTAQEPIPEELLAEHDRRAQRQKDLADSRAIINLQQIDIDPVQTVQVDILVGGEGNDTLRGSNFNDKIFGDAGDDTIVHTPGGDLVFDGEGTQDKYQVSGTEANNTIVVKLQPGVGLVAPHVLITVDNVSTCVDHTEIEVASVLALGGDDKITVEVGNNAIMRVDADGGVGNDILDASTLQDKATLRGGLGNDTILGGLSDDVIEGGDGNDVLIGGNGFEQLFGGAGDDQITGGLGQDVFDGGLSVDRLIEKVAGVVTFSSPLTLAQTVPGDTISVVDTLVSGTVEEVVLTGSDGPDAINTSLFAGKANIQGGAGNDTLIGGSSTETIDGGAGNDSITGNAGNDVLTGGADVDRLVEAGNVNFTLSNTVLTGLGNDSLSGFESAQLTGGIGANTLIANGFSGPVTLDGGEGNDTLIGTAQDDTLIGGGGLDTLRGQGGNDTLIGGAGNDSLFGDDGND